MAYRSPLVHFSGPWKDRRARTGVISPGSVIRGAGPEMDDILVDGLILLRSML